jgi:Resolvase, N terminal domain
MRVALYARVSTRENQDPKLQLQPMREYAAARRWEVAEYVDRASAADMAAGRSGNDCSGRASTAPRPRDGMVARSAFPLDTQLSADLGELGAARGRLLLPDPGHRHRQPNGAVAADRAIRGGRVRARVDRRAGARGMVNTRPERSSDRQAICRGEPSRCPRAAYRPSPTGGWHPQQASGSPPAEGGDGDAGAPARLNGFRD